MVDEDMEDTEFSKQNAKVAQALFVFSFEYECFGYEYECVEFDGDEV